MIGEARSNNRAGADLLKFLVHCEVFWKPLSTIVRPLQLSVEAQRGVICGCI
jgi:hypothetical protein